MILGLGDTNTATTSNGSLAALEPAPHFIAKNFLGRDEVDKLLRYCIGNESAFSEALVGDGKDSKVDGQHRRSRSLVRPDQFIYAVHSAFQARLSALLPQVTAALRQSPFEATVYELELVAHNDGSFFAKHIDTFTGAGELPPTQRLISAVYYFFAEPKAFSGGALRLYPLLDSGATARFVDIEPVNDTLVCFPSFAPHEVRPIVCPSGRFGDSRFAINTWICRNNPRTTARQAGT